MISVLPDERYPDGRDREELETPEVPEETPDDVPEAGSGTARASEPAPGDEGAAARWRAGPPQAWLDAVAAAEGLTVEGRASPGDAPDVADQEGEASELAADAPIAVAPDERREVGADGPATPAMPAARPTDTGARLEEASVAVDRGEDPTRESHRRVHAARTSAPRTGRGVRVRRHMRRQAHASRVPSTAIRPRGAEPRRPGPLSPIGPPPRTRTVPPRVESATPPGPERESRSYLEPAAHPWDAPDPFPPAAVPAASTATRFQRPAWPWAALPLEVDRDHMADPEPQRWPELPPSSIWSRPSQVGSTVEDGWAREERLRDERRSL